MVMRAMHHLPARLLIICIGRFDATGFARLSFYDTKAMDVRGLCDGAIGASYIPLLLRWWAGFITRLTVGVSSFLRPKTRDQGIAITGKNLPHRCNCLITAPGVTF